MNARNGVPLTGRLSPILAMLAGIWAVPPALALDWSGLNPIGPVSGIVRTERGMELSCADGSVLQITVLAPDPAAATPRM